MHLAYVSVGALQAELLSCVSTLAHFVVAGCVLHLRECLVTVEAEVHAEVGSALAAVLVEAVHGDLYNMIGDVLTC